MVADNRVDHTAQVFAVAGDSAASGRSEIAASWLRSLQRYKLDPRESRKPTPLTERELREAREALGPMLHIAQPSLDLLAQAVAGSGCCVLFTDRAGVLLDRRGSAGDDRSFYAQGLWTGSVWSEAFEGTNGIGTCLAEERALTIHRDQHFHTRNIDLSCTVAPVYDHRGKLAAALDVSSCRSDLDRCHVRLIAAAVADAARRIETLNFCQAFAGARIVVVPESRPTGAALLAVNGDDLVIGATRAARLSLALTDARLDHPLPTEMVLSGHRTGGERTTGERVPGERVPGERPPGAPTVPVEDLDRAERGALQRALARTSGNVTAAARLLGISRATLHRKMNRLGVNAGQSG